MFLVCASDRTAESPSRCNARASMPLIRELPADELLRLTRETQAAIRRLEPQERDYLERGTIVPYRLRSELGYLREMLERYRHAGVRARTREIAQFGINVWPLTYTALADRERRTERWYSRNRPYLEPSDYTPETYERIRNSV